MSEAGVELRVREALSRDVGRGIVRLPESARQQLGVLSGDTVVVEGDRATVVKVWPGGDDLAGDALRIDGETRANAGASLGDPVTVRPVPVSDAATVTVTPLEPVEAGPSTVESTVRAALLDRPVAPDDRIRVQALGEGTEFTVVAVTPDPPAVVTDATDITVEEYDPDTVSAEARRVGTTYEDIGGLGEELRLVREMVELPLSDPDRFRRLGVEPPRGVLLYGPPGTGKTLIARAVANEADAHFISVSGPEIVRKYKGESEQRLREVFEEARNQAPTVVFFDELDAIAGARDADADMENRIVAQLLSLMDGLESRGEVVVVGATNRIDAVDPALRRPGRFDREIEVGVPDRDGRRAILDIHTRGMPLSDDVDLDALADRTHGYVGADIQALATEAGMQALRREEETDTPAVTQRDFDQAFATVDPSALRAFVAERPTVDFTDVGGYATVKETLREAVVWPVANPSLFAATGTDPPTGVLLSGPPGTGKSLLAEAVAGEAGVNVLRVAGPELLDRYVGESEQAVRELFERARQAAPAIVVLDELDAIAGRRGPGGDSGVTDRVVSQLLSELDAAADNPGVTVIAATNRPETLDQALRRPGRLERHIRVRLPDEGDRQAILAVHARDRPVAPDVDLDALATELDGFTGADLAAVLRSAALTAIRDRVEEAGDVRAVDDPGSVQIDERHLRAAIEELQAESEDR